MANMHRYYFPIFFLCSGFSALVYEVVWSKQLSLLFGATLPALSIVTATYMAGLAIGNALFGKITSSQRNPVRLYALVECGIGLTALGVHLLLPGIGEGYVTLAQQNHAGAGLLHILRFGVTALLLLPTTILIGGTLPVMVRMVRESTGGIRFGRLYAVNTLGAVLGCMIGGYWLIAFFGMQGTLLIATGCNLAVSAGAFFISWSTTSVRSEDDPRPAQGVVEPAKTIYLAILLQGALFLAYEILWTRVFLQFLGNTTFAFSTILGVFLLCLATGSALYARWCSRHPSPRQLILILFFISGIFVLATAPFYDQLFYLFDRLYRLAGDRWFLLATGRFMIITMAIGIPCVLSGAILPAALAAIVPKELNLPATTGRLLFINTCGALIGSLAGGFLLIETFGLLGSFKTLAFINTIAALAFFSRSKEYYSGNAPRILVPALLACLLALTVSWNQHLMNSGPYIYSHHFADAGGLSSLFPTQTIVHLEEGNEATVMITEDTRNSTRSIKVNGKVDGSNGFLDLPTNTLLGLLPPMFHSSPRDTLLIGLMTGTTLGELQKFPNLSIDVLEISPEVVRAAQVFDPQNIERLKQPGTRLHLDDGRNWLLTREKPCDLIVSQPSNPWLSGNANLFTHEFYELAKKRLRPDGIFCLWIPLYDFPLMASMWPYVPCSNPFPTFGSSTSTAVNCLFLPLPNLCSGMQAGSIISWISPKSETSSATSPFRSPETC